MKAPKWPAKRVKVHRAKKRPAKRGDNPIIDKLMQLKYSINDAYRNGYDNIIREEEGIDDKNYVMKLIQDVRKGEFTKLSREDGLKCNGLWRKYAN